MNYFLFDVVVLNEDIPEKGLKAGMQGAIIEVFNEPVRAYEVEFCDEEGRTIAQLALSDDQFRIRR